MCKVQLRHYKTCNDTEEAFEVPLSSSRWKPCDKPTDGLRFYRCEYLDIVTNEVEGKCHVCVDEEADTARIKEEQEQSKLVKKEVEKQRPRDMKYSLRSIKPQGPRKDEDDKEYVPGLWDLC